MYANTSQDTSKDVSILVFASFLNRTDVLSLKWYYSSMVLLEYGSKNEFKMVLLEYGITRVWL